MHKRYQVALAFCGAFALTPAPALALEEVSVSVAGGDTDLQAALRGASATVAALDEGRTDPEDVLGAALSDYRNMVEALYAQGYYGGVVHIYVDGREAADIPLLNTPARVDRVTIDVQQGRQFTFGKVQIAPAPPAMDSAPPMPGEVAEAARVREAVSANIDGWRAVGHAKAAPDSQRVIADHPAATLDVEVGINPGPRVRFGQMRIVTPSEVRETRIRRIAGFPEGEVFSPEALQMVGTRLRRTGTFASVSLQEGETLGPMNDMDVALSLADAKPRRFGFGAEISSLEGATISGFWLHRNLFGGAERLRLDAEISNIGGDVEGGEDYSIGARYEIPATFGPDTTAFLVARAERLDEPDFFSDSYKLGFGASKIFSDSFQGEIGLNYEFSETRDDLGAREFTLLTLPVSATWDRRDDALNPTGGVYLAATLTPFVGLEGSTSGLRTEVDARAYRGFGADDGVVLAGRVQLGSVTGPALTGTRPDFLFFSGGGGTVRGQPYQSLDVDLGGGREMGGRSFLGLSGEVRVDVTDKIGAVAFYDAGYIGAEEFFDGTGEWHAGAGLGLRYQTGLGPIRLDVATPVSGSTGDGVQVYIGIGQAF